MDRRKIVAFMGSLLDARYWMLDNQQLTRSEFQKHRVSSIQYPEFENIFNILYRTADSDYNDLCNCRVMLAIVKKAE